MGEGDTTGDELGDATTVAVVGAGVVELVLTAGDALAHAEASAMTAAA